MREWLPFAGTTEEAVAVECAIAIGEERDTLAAKVRTLVEERAALAIKAAELDLLQVHILEVCEQHGMEVDELNAQVVRARAETQEACALALETESRSDAGVRGAALREAAAIVRAMPR